MVSITGEIQFSNSIRWSINASSGTGMGASYPWEFALSIGGLYWHCNLDGRGRGSIYAPFHTGSGRQSTDQVHWENFTLSNCPLLIIWSISPHFFSLSVEFLLSKSSRGSNISSVVRVFFHPMNMNRVMNLESNGTITERAHNFVCLCVCAQCTISRLSTAFPPSLFPRKILAQRKRISPSERIEWFTSRISVIFLLSITPSHVDYANDRRTL